MELNFESLTIAELRVLTEELLKQHPEIQTAQELLIKHSENANQKA